jgi:hypothetical protein
LRYAFLGELFLLLTPNNLSDYIWDDLTRKKWSFGEDDLTEVMQQKMSITAKSDYIRLRYIYEHGGVWIDADCLPLRSPLVYLNYLAEKQWFWWSEVVFGAQPKLEFLSEAATNMIRQPVQKWGNPGKIKDIIKAQNNNCGRFILDRHLIKPQDATYSWNSYDILLNTSTQPKDFISDRQIILNLFNRMTSCDHRIVNIFKGYTIDNIADITLEILDSGLQSKPLLLKIISASIHSIGQERFIDGCKWLSSALGK